jgi:hypothetical protein
MFTNNLSRREMLTMTAALAISSLVLPGAAAAGRRTANTTTLTDDETNDLIFMREEEKLARDVYLTLYGIWETPVFANIATSEQQHMDAILGLLNTYKIPDPTVGKLVGEFVNDELQNLYDELVAKGAQSALDALMVGGIIEETDIEDIQSAMETTTVRNIDKVYSNLLNGSYNHLRAFASNITAITGQPYVAQVVSQDVVDAILGN